jgi:hypothetical protein
MPSKHSNKSSLSIGGRMTSKAANIAGIILALAAFIAASGVTAAAIIYALK